MTAETVKCQICAKDLATILMLVSQGNRTAKAKVCADCFGIVKRLASDAEVKQVTPEVYDAAKETWPFIGN